MSNQAIFRDIKLSVGDLLRIHQKIIEGEKEKVQTFEGRVVALKGRDYNKTFTLRRMGVDNVAVEKIYPLSLPSLVKIEIKKSIPAKRAKLYCLRRIAS